MIVIDISEIIHAFYIYYKDDGDLLQDKDNWFVFNFPYPLQETEIKNIFSKEQIVTLKEKHLLKHNEPYPICFKENILSHIVRRLYRYTLDKRAIKAMIDKKSDYYWIFIDVEANHYTINNYKLEDLIDQKINDILVYYKYIKNYILDLRLVNNNLLIKRKVNVYQMLFDYLNTD